MPDYQVTIDPIDPILFRDNRSARAEFDSVIQSQFPSPQRIFGAVGGQIVRALKGKKDYTDWQVKVEKTLGKFMEDEANTDSAELLGFTLKDDQGQPWFPKPCSFRVWRSRAETDHHPKLTAYDYPKIEPIASESSNCPFTYLLKWDPLPKVRQEFEEPLWVEKETFKTFLSGKDLKNGKCYFRQPDQFYITEYRTGLAIDEKTFANKSGYLFSRPYWRFLRGFGSDNRTPGTTGLIAWLRTPASSDCSWDGEGILGGDQRRALFSFSSDDLLNDLKSCVCDHAETSEGFFVYALTPVVIDARGVCIHVETIKPLAAAIGKPTFYSGWYMQGKKQYPRKMRHCAPAGSVWYYRWPDACSVENRIELIEKNWMKSLCPNDANFGYGRILIGVWK